MLNIRLMRCLPRTKLAASAMIITGTKLGLPGRYGRRSRTIAPVSRRRQAPSAALVSTIPTGYSSKPGPRMDRLAGACPQPLPRFSAPTSGHYPLR
jgi:hypothetical protein